MPKTIAIDFDGVVHQYSRGWWDGSCYDHPVEGAIEAIEKLRDKGYNVVIFTARDDLEAVRFWFEDHMSWAPEVTNKKPRASAYIDDRAIRFTFWKDILNYF
jgi:hypothetical protein